jgi:hypothetical protein
MVAVVVVPEEDCWKFSKCFRQLLRYDTTVLSDTVHYLRCGICEPQRHYGSFVQLPSSGDWVSLQ